jgi:hypothetical protein
VQNIGVVAVEEIGDARDQAFAVGAGNQQDGGVFSHYRCGKFLEKLIIFKTAIHRRGRGGKTRHYLSYADSPIRWVHFLGQAFEFLCVLRALCGSIAFSKIIHQAQALCGGHP